MLELKLCEWCSCEAFTASGSEWHRYRACGREAGREGAPQDCTRGVTGEGGRVPSTEVVTSFEVVCV